MFMSRNWSSEAVLTKLGLCLMHTLDDMKHRKSTSDKELLNDGSSGGTKSFRDNDLMLDTPSNLPIVMRNCEL